MTSASLASKTILDKLLTSNGRGWKLDLFTNVSEDYICAQCENVCKNAVSLICEFGDDSTQEHSDDEVFLYCKICLESNINNSANKCPINQHSNPKFMSMKVTRRHIMRSRVRCPLSNGAQSASVNNSECGAGAFVSTDEGRLRTSNVNNHNNNADAGAGAEENGCQFEGTLSKLIEEHIQTCIQQRQQRQSADSNTAGAVDNMFLLEQLQQTVMKHEADINLLVTKVTKTNNIRNNKNGKSVAIIKENMNALQVQIAGVNHERDALHVDIQQNAKNIQLLIANNQSLKEDLNAQKLETSMIVKSNQLLQNEIHSQASMIKQLREEMQAIQQTRTQSQTDRENNRGIRRHRQHLLRTHKIELRYKSHRANDGGLLGHPRNLLLAAPAHIVQKGHYTSARCSSFSSSSKGRDWLIFEIQPTNIKTADNNGNNTNTRRPLSINIKMMPTLFRIQNCTDSNAVKSVEIFIGAKKWRKLHANRITVHNQNTDWQSFPLWLEDNDVSLLSSLIKQRQWMQIKIEFIANHGYSGGYIMNGPKFACVAIEFEGHQI